MRKSKYMVKKFLLGYPEAMGHRGESNQQTCLDPSCLPHLIHICESEYAKFPFLMQAFLPEFVQAGQNKAKLLLSLLDFSFQREITCMPGWHVLGRLILNLYGTYIHNCVCGCVSGCWNVSLSGHWCLGIYRRSQRLERRKRSLLMDFKKIHFFLFKPVSKSRGDCNWAIFFHDLPLGNTNNNNNDKNRYLLNTYYVCQELF